VGCVVMGFIGLGIDVVWLLEYVGRLSCSIFNNDR